jgi:1-acyl-sn-glycerol-3-phosphate acyltransferase
MTPDELFPEDTPDAFEPELPARWSPAAHALARVFRHRIEGLERIPTGGPALLVFNHGPFPVDAYLFTHRVYEAQGRWIRFLGERMFFEWPRIAAELQRWGVVEGNHYQARRRFQAGDLVGVFPGGARETWKPHREARTLRWEGRAGFARLAFKAGVPIIPVACPAADDLYYVVNDGYATAERLLGKSRLPLPIFFGLGPLPFPVRLVHYVGSPIHPTPLPRETGDQTVERLRRLTHESMESLLARR